MKIWNSVKATAYDVDFNIPGEYKNMVCRDKVPYEFLEPGKSFEEIVIVHFENSEKFKVITTWNNRDGNQYFKEQIVSI